MRFASCALALILSMSAVSPKSGVSTRAPKTPKPATAVPVSNADLSGQPFRSAITFLNGSPANPAAYPATVDGFTAYLRACGVQDYAAQDLTRPNHPDIARRLGYTYFVPPQNWWDRGAALALLAQGIHRTASVPVVIRNWWRPEDYNRQPGVDGARASDHISATALDLDYASPADRAKAESFLRELNARAPWMKMSMGLGPVTTHIGLLSPRGSREWHYAGYTPTQRVASPVRRRA
jgi:hypothetical protein